MACQTMAEPQQTRRPGSRRGAASRDSCRGVRSHTDTTATAAGGAGGMVWLKNPIAVSPAMSDFSCSDVMGSCGRRGGPMSHCAPHNVWAQCNAIAPCQVRKPMHNWRGCAPSARVRDLWRGKAMHHTHLVHGSLPCPAAVRGKHRADVELPHLLVERGIHVTLDPVRPHAVESRGVERFCSNIVRGHGLGEGGTATNLAEIHTQATHDKHVRCRTSQDAPAPRALKHSSQRMSHA